MYRESQKIHIIEEILKVEDPATLHGLETFLKKSRKAKPQKTILDFIGVVTKTNAAAMKKAIKETCEVINEEDWK